MRMQCQVKYTPIQAEEYLCGLLQKEEYVTNK